jgi:hypothetical protein
MELSTSSKRYAMILAPLLFVVYSILFIGYGTSAMIVDSSIRADPCGRSTHMWKYALLNTIFSVFSLGTYGIFPGGGEAARARALMILILHFALSTWGVLLWAYDGKCLDLIRSTHDSIHGFQNLCVFHNIFFLVFYTLHESCLGHQLGGDLTLAPEISNVGKMRGGDPLYANYAADVAKPAPAAGFVNQAPPPSSSAMEPVVAPNSPPQHLKSPGELGPLLSDKQTVEITRD